jgi:streptogramin lyase
VRRGLGLGDVVADRFKLVAEIGEGGMGRVYEALDLRHDRQAAVKVIYRRLAADEVFRARFEREALAAERATHPHVLPVWDHGAANGHLFLATPLCDSDLAAELEEQGCLELETALAIVGQIAWALDWAHGREVVHRDVKPENILLVAGPVEQHAYLADFGLARIATSATLTQFGALVGLSPAYAAPEQWLAERVTPATDQYALAGTLYCCLMGRPPFWPVGDFEGLRHAHVEQDPPPMERESDPRLALASPALLRGLAKDPEQRYSSCGDLVVAVRAAVEPEDSALSLPPTTGEHADPHATTEPEQPSSAGVQDRQDAPVHPQGRGAPTRSARPPPGAQVEAAGDATRPDRDARETSERAREPSTASVDGAAEVAHGRRRVLVAVVALALVVAGVGAAVALFGGDKDSIERVHIGGRPVDAVAVGGSVWVADKADRTLTRLDPRTAKRSGQPVDVGGAPFRLAGGGRRLWAISASPPQAFGFDTRDRSPQSQTVGLSSTPIDVSVGEGAVWIAAKPREGAAPGGGRVIQLDPVSRKETGIAPTKSSLTAVTTGEGAIWALAGDTGRLYRVRSEAPAVANLPVPVGAGSSAVVAAPSGIWVANGQAGKLLHIDVDHNRVDKRISVERGRDIGLAAGDGAIWWIDTWRGAVIRIDAHKGRPVGGEMDVGDDAGGATVLAGSLWVTVPSDRSIVRIRF